MIRQLLSYSLVVLALSGCSTGGKDQTRNEGTEEGESVDDEQPGDDNEQAPAQPATVQNVAVMADGDAWTFSVTLESPDTGCGQYADWWEVVSSDGEQLIYRRILAHSHVDEQPFTRGGGPVEVQPDQEVVVRAHMNPGGYGTGTVAMRGSVQEGFKPTELKPGFGKQLGGAEPLPGSCAF